MATTTNYGWDTPDDTDLVKDGASAIRTLGSSVDTTVKNLNPETTLGDISYRSSTANTNTRLAIGTSGQVLTVSSGVPAWVTPSGAGSNFVALNGTGTTLSGTVTSITGISGYDKYYVFLYNAKCSATLGGGFALTINGDTTNKYGASALQLTSSSTALNIVGINFADINSQPEVTYGGTGSSTQALSATTLITGGSSSGAKIINNIVGVNASNNNYVNLDTLIYTGTSVISSIQARCNGGSFGTGGKIIIYGSV